MEKKYGAITSSQNPEEIATRVKGIILGASSIIIFIASQVFHMTVTANDVITLATELSTVAGAIWTLYGAGLWLISKIYKTA